MRSYKAIAAASIVASLAGCSAAASHATVSAGDREACRGADNIYQLAVAANGDVFAEQHEYAVGAVSGALQDAASDATTLSLSMALDAASMSGWAADNAPTPSDLLPLLRQCEAITEGKP